MEEQFEKAEFFDTPEQLAEAMATENSEPQVTDSNVEQSEEQPVVQEEAPQQQEEYYQPQEQAEETEYSDEDAEGMVLEYLSERLGRQIGSFDDLNQVEQAGMELDERVRAIADFVEKTNRSPDDWFRYQALDSSEMDDITAIKVDMASQYPNLSNEEIDILIADKYKTNAELYDEEQIRLANLQLKIDAQEARATIEEIRETYAMPDAVDDGDDNQVITDDWIEAMARETEALEGLEFDLGNGKTFSYGLDDSYREQLIDKNVRLDEFFDPYVDDDGNWDYDTLNSHRALIDNIDSIIASAYNQGVGDGQRGLVDRAANVSSSAPQSQPEQVSPVAEQLKNIFTNNSNKMTFKI